MKRNQGGKGLDKGGSLLLSIILVFCILAAVVFSVSQKISAEMSDAAVQNLTESLDLIKSTIEAIRNKEAEFQKIMAADMASRGEQEDYVRDFTCNDSMVRVSFIRAGEQEGISDTGETFSEEGLDFSSKKTIQGLAVSESYLNYMGTWAYTMKCPVEKDGRELGVLYVEYVYDSLDRSLPNGFYNRKAMLYVMDAETKRLVLKPKGMGERDAGHLNLDDFYHANEITEEDLLAQVADCLESGKNIMFRHDIRGKESLNYMWMVNDGALYLIGYVPVEAIQQEGKTVNQNIFIVVAVMLIAFFLCCALYYFNQRQQNKIRKEREEERELHNQQLAEALQAAQIASNSKTTFLSNMSHDIRTPMNAVIGFTGLLAKEADHPDKVQVYTKKIMASGQHLLSLINDILDVSKIESGKVVLTVEEFTLNDLVSSVDAIVRPMAKAKGQEFRIEVTGIKHEYLLGDETRVNQILINLLSNAVKYTQEHGNIWFRLIGLKQHSPQFEHIRIEVEDDGYGMTPEYLETIFDAFTRAENSTTNKVQGTGLGMAITKNIVELMGGTIDVSSEVNRGSLFRVDLEFRIPEGRTDCQFWEQSMVKRILAVDEDVDACENIRLVMKDTGVAVDIASDAADAGRRIREAAAQGECYDVILLDVDGTDMDVMEALAALREALPKRKADEPTPVLLLGEGLAEDVEPALKTEGVGVLAKPFFVTALREKIAEMQARDRGENANASEEENDSLEGLRFLAAEDNEINMEILEEILSMEGAACEIVENGELALERFMACEPGEFDAILMDVQMPVMNGYEATRAIRALERADAASIPIIAMTANAFAEDEKEALNAGMNVHLAKPIDVGLLKKVIRRYVQKG